jgi:hypothetical protein
VGGREFLIGGDIITSINGTPLDSEEKLLDVMRALKVGATVTLKAFRDGKDVEVAYVLPERPRLPGDVQGQQSLVPLRRQGVRPPPARDPAKVPR